MSMLYELAGISKQGHHQAMKRRSEQESRIPFYTGLIGEARLMHPGMGLRTIYETFRPEGIGRDAFIALGAAEGLRLEAPRAPQRTTRSHPAGRYRNLLADREVTDVNQVWVSDITYIRLGERFYYLVLIMDVYSRRIIGYAASANLLAANNLIALQMALDLRGVSDYGLELIHHSDRGGQYISKDYTGLLTKFGIAISMCSSVLENAHCERLNGTIKNQYLLPWGVRTPAELRRRLPQAVGSYNSRPHQSLGRMTPIAFEAAIRSVPLNERKPMRIFTVPITHILPPPEQLSLFDL
ncbi:MAG: IS3 family transposase [Bacteroidia bacterium]|nr:IS3 family transposase [Bacteroidia bacterium]